MCKAPKPPAPPVERRPQYLRNPVLDSAEGSTVGQLRIGRSALRTDLDRFTIGSQPRSARVQDREDFLAPTGATGLAGLVGNTLRQAINARNGY